LNEQIVPRPLMNISTTSNRSNREMNSWRVKASKKCELVERGKFRKINQ
jgi:hypothetical protein